MASHSCAPPHPQHLEVPFCFLALLDVGQYEKLNLSKFILLLRTLDTKTEASSKEGGHMDEEDDELETSDWKGPEVISSRDSRTGSMKGILWRRVRELERALSMQGHTRASTDPSLRTCFGPPTLSWA